ncbi:MAG TPA: hypothetical protein VK543_17090 [Puia sp.]|nr:hypothetical protein [Puia sp.]
MKIKLLSVLAVYCCLPGTTTAQTDLQDTGFQQASVHNTIDLYYKNIGENAHLYNGSEYMLYSLYDKQDSKNLYFQSIFLQNGDVFYDGTLYQDVPLTYDLLHDDLVTTRYKQNYRIRLNADKVGYFKLAGHQFVRIIDDTAQRLPFGTGYYDLMYNGKSAVLVKRRKRLEERLSSAGNFVNYLADDRYFIRRDGSYYPVWTKRSVLDVFKDKKKELRKYLRKNKITFAPFPEFGIVKASEYYDQIKN